MTSLEIKRLDHVNGVAGSGGGSSKPNSPTKSPLAQQIYVKSADNQAKEVEIPISIIKSQSFTNNQELAAAGQLTPSKSPIVINSSPGSTVNTRTLNTSNSNINDNNNTSSNNNNRDSLNRLSDYNISTTDMSDLRFNKYGFVDKTQTDDDSTTATGGRGGKGGGAKTLKPSDAHSLNSSSNPATNLKDYLQNTDVEQFAEHLPIKVIQSREVKWMDMLNNYDSWMKNNFAKIKSRCRKGIPQSMRSRAWMYLTGAVFVKKANPGYYLECVENRNNYDITKYVEDIKKDLHRQFPSHELFMKEEGRKMLFNVLTAYAVHNREVGYCQAQGPIAALLLMHMPEEDSFWMLIRISDFYLKEYFKPGLEKVQIDGQALFYLFKKENETAHKLMIKQGIDPILYMTEWFMCIYARTLPWCTVLRVWDMFFCEGVKILYKVGLYLMMNAFGTRQILQKCQQQGMYETLNCLKNLPIECLDEASLVRGVDKIDFSKKDFDKAFDKSRDEFQKQMSSRKSDAKQPPPVSSYKAKKNKEKKK